MVDMPLNQTNYRILSLIFWQSVRESYPLKKKDLKKMHDDCKYSFSISLYFILSGLTDETKRNFFQVGVMSVLLYGCTI